MPVIDVHTHMLSNEYMDLIRKHGGPNYTVKELMPGVDAIHKQGAAFHTPNVGHFDYDLRVKEMDKHGVDISVISLAAPSCYWGDREISLRVASHMNDDMAGAQTQYPDRIRWFATLPWQFPDAAVEELARACDNGAVGVMVLANVEEMKLTDPHLEPIWAEVDRRALPVLLHPTAPPAVGQLGMDQYTMVASIGFMIDTTLAVGRMIFDGFFDRFPNLKIIAAHLGATVPYLAGRWDKVHSATPVARAGTETRPSEYIRNFLYYDAITYMPETLKYAVDIVGSDRIMYGSDYPHNIGDMPGCLERVDMLPPDQKKALRGGNALRIFKI